MVLGKEMQLELGLKARLVLRSGLRWGLWLSWRQKGLGSGIYFEGGQM